MLYQIPYRGRTLTTKYSVDEHSAEVLDLAMWIKDHGWQGPPAVCFDGSIVYRWEEVIAAHIAGVEPLIHTIEMREGAEREEFARELGLSNNDLFVEIDARILHRRGLLGESDLVAILANIASRKEPDILFTPYDRLVWNAYYHDSGFTRHTARLRFPWPETSRRVLEMARRMKDIGWFGPPAVRIGDVIRLGYDRVVAAKVAGINPQVYHLSVNASTEDAKRIEQDLYDNGMEIIDIVFFASLLHERGAVDDETLDILCAWKDAGA
jgi:hypothetical protein